MRRLCIYSQRVERVRMAHAGKPIETSDELIERLGGYTKYNLLWREVLKECGARDGVIFYDWSRSDTFQLPLIQDFIKDARLRPADTQTLTERLDRLVFSEIDRDGEMFRDVDTFRPATSRSVSYPFSSPGWPAPVSKYPTTSHGTTSSATRRTWAFSGRISADFCTIRRCPASSSSPRREKRKIPTR